MSEKTIKIDESTSRLVDDMAYYLQSTKKAIIRDAVADFAEARRPRGRYSAGLSHASEMAGGELADGTSGRGRTVFADGIERSRRPTFEELPVRERLELRRNELIRAFARRDAHEIRVMNPRPLLDWDGNPIDDAFALDEPIGVRPADEVIELLVTTDVAGGGEEAVRLEEIARELLRAPVRVESATKLRLFNPARLEQARRDSVPL